MKRCISCGKIIWWWQFKTTEGKEHLKCWNARAERINKLLDRKKELSDNMNVLHKKYEIGPGDWVVILRILLEMHPEVKEHKAFKDYETRMIKYGQETKEFQTRLEKTDKELSELGEF